MILHDRVTVVMSVPFDPPQYDDLGNDVYQTITETVPAEVFPLGTDGVVTATRDKVVSRYRMVLAPTVDIPPRIGDKLRLEWDVFTLTADTTSGLFVDGGVERHMMHGRVHHYELITKQVVG